MARIELSGINKKFSGKKKSDVFIDKAIQFKLRGKSSNRPYASWSGSKGEFSLKDIDLSVPDGKTVVILGPSGCGKTTLLKIIAGLERQDTGKLLFSEIDMSNALPKERKIGMVFQNYALYPHLTSKKNILTYYLFKKKTKEMEADAEEKFKKTSELLGVEMKYLLDRNPSRLSGGEKQRVAIGRCITREPNVFLLDEPFSNPDARLREKYRVQLKQLLRKFNVTAVYVTHDQEEALILADILVIMNEGKIVQTGTFEAIYNDPANIFVAEFINPNTESVPINFIDGRLFSEKVKDFLIGIHPQDLKINSEKISDSIPGRISDVRDIPVKNVSIMDIACGENEISAKEKPGHNFMPGQDIWITFEKYFLFDKETGERSDKSI